MRKATDCVTKAVKAKKQCEKKTNLLVYKKEGKDKKCGKRSYVVSRKWHKRCNSISFTSAFSPQRNVQNTPNASAFALVPK